MEKPASRVPPSTNVSLFMRSSASLASESDISERIPLEIIDYCLHFLKSDKGSLKHCTLVCKTWMPFAQAHLFHKFTLHFSEQTSTKHLSLLDGPQCRLLDYLYGIVVHRVAASGKPIVQQRLWFNRHVYPILVAVGHRKRQFSITCNELGNPYGLGKVPPWRDSAFSAVCRDFLNRAHTQALLTRLHLRACWFMGFSELIAVICAPQRLQELSLSVICIVRREETTPKAIDTRMNISPHLQQLKLDPSVLIPFLKWLLLEPPEGRRIPAIHTVHMQLPFTLVEGHAVVGSFFHALGRRLRYLKLSISQNSLSAIPSLSQNTTLEEFIITHCVINDAGSRAPALASLLNLIHKLESQSLRKISMQFDNKCNGSMPKSPWAIINEELSSSAKFPALNVVAIRVAGSQDERKLVTSCFKDLCDKKVLHLLWSERRSNRNA